MDRKDVGNYVLAAVLFAVTIPAYWYFSERARLLDRPGQLSAPSGVGHSDQPLPALTAAPYKRAHQAQSSVAQPPMHRRTRS